ncbi:MAG: ABC transporter permease [Cyanophyceae cyanobacterium]
MELFLAELKRIWTEFIRYPVDALSVVFITTLIFYALFASVQYVSGPAVQFGDRLDAIVVGYILWSLIVFIVNEITFGLQIEAQTGTLEQVFLSPYGTRRVFLTRALASLTLRLVLNGMVLLLTLLLTGRRLSFPPSLLLPLVTVLLGAYGLAFMLAATALLFKRISQLLSLLQLGLVFLLMAPTETWTGVLQWLRLLLPMTLGAGMLRELMARSGSLSGMECAIALLNGGLYLALGLSLFRRAERIAKKQGRLGGY